MIKAFFVKLGLIHLLSYHYLFIVYILLIALFIIVVYFIFDRFRESADENNSDDSALEPTTKSDWGEIPTRKIEGVANDEDLLSNTRDFIENYQHPRDFERLYDRLWHCLRWQQVNQEDDVLDIVRDLYRIFADFGPVDVRWKMYHASKERIKFGDFSPSCFLNFLIHETDEEIVSTAAIDILSYSGKLPDGVPKGGQILFEILRQKMPMCPGAVFGGAVAFGDPRQVQSLTAMVSCLSPTDIEVAARQKTGFVNHAVIQFWIAFALANVDGDDAISLAVTRSAASALVLARHLAHDEAVVEIERLFPTDPEAPRVKILQQWNFEQYARWARKDLLEIEARECEPKVFSIVLEEWGLRNKSLH